MSASKKKPSRPIKPYDHQKFEPRRRVLRWMIDNIGFRFLAKVDRVEITELREQTFYAVVYLSSDAKQYTVDARPSDSIALALKTGAKIYVNEELFNLKGDESQETPPMATDPESLRERLRRINPEDFGKYSL